VTNERCRRIVMTGSTEGQADDWGAQLAGRSQESLLLPYLVLSGTAFTSQYSDRVVRIGSAGQLSNLLEGRALERADTPFPRPSAEREALADAYVRQRMSARAGADVVAAAGGRALDDLASLRGYLDVLDIGALPTGCFQLDKHMGAVWDVFELGLARSALIEYRGWCSEGWDTHASNARQALHFEDLFDLLAKGLQDLGTRTGVGGQPLSDEVVVVVYSEMGRTPRLNASSGRDHWTFTSAMVVGAGVRGGQVVGGFDDSGYGAATDLASGAPHAGGTPLTAAHLGATLLALGDVDPGETEPIAAVLG
jgi:hypothetical protein